jgi:hypothetical protein
MGFNASNAATEAWLRTDAPKKQPPPLNKRSGPDGSTICYRHDVAADVLHIYVDVKSFVAGVDAVRYGRVSIKKGTRAFALACETEYQARKVSHVTHNQILEHIAKMVEEIHGHPILYAPHPMTS